MQVDLHLVSLFANRIAFGIYRRFWLEQIGHAEEKAMIEDSNIGADIFILQMCI